MAVDRRVHPHAYAHTLAHELYREGSALETSKQQLGHAHARTTARRPWSPRTSVAP